MREKVQRFLTLTGFDVDAIATEMTEMMVGGLRKEFEDGFGEALPKKPVEALGAFEKALKSQRAAFYDRVVETVEKNFTEEEVDALIAFYESPAGLKLIAVLPTVRPTILAAQEEWRDSSLKSVEGEFHALLGDSVNPVESIATQ